MPHLEATIREGIASWPVKPKIVTGENEKRAVFRLARAALAKSGTVTLELALSGIPMVTAYRVGTVEAFILRRAIRVSSVILANLVIGEDVIPEFPAGGLHAGKARAGARGGADRYAGTPAAGRRVRPARSDHVDRQHTAERARGRYRARDHAPRAGSRVLGRSPPSIRKHWLVMRWLSSEARNSAIFAMSSGVTASGMAWRVRNSAMTRSSGYHSRRCRSVITIPGAIALTRMRSGPTDRASELVKPTIAAFAAA